MLLILWCNVLKNITVGDVDVIVCNVTGSVCKHDFGADRNLVHVSLINITICQGS